MTRGRAWPRFLVGEFLGRVYAPLARPNWLPGAIGTTVVVVVAWAYFIWTGSINTIWPMFGVANQLLATVALSVATTVIINVDRAKYMWVTLVPMAFLSVTTLTAGWLNVTTTTGRKPSAPIPLCALSAWWTPRSPC